MNKESIWKRLVRNIVVADYKSTDTVPFIGSSVFGGTFAPTDTVHEIESMSRVGKFFLYLWFFFIVFIMLGLVFVGAAVAFDAQTIQKLGLLSGIFLIVLELFVLIQGLSVLSYFRWRIKQRLLKR